MSIGEGIGQGLMFAAQNVSQNRRSDKEQKRQLEMFNLKRAADIEDLQKQNEIKRQTQLQEQTEAQNNNLNAGEAILALTGQKEPEGFDHNRLRYLAPTQLNSTLDDVRNAATKKEQAELKKQQAKISNQIYKNVLSGGPLDPDVLSQAEELGVDTSKAFGLYQGRKDREATREDNQAFRQSLLGQQFSNQKELKQITASLRPPKVGRGGGGPRGGGHSAGGGKPMKRFNPETNSFGFYDSRTGQPVGQASRPMPPINITFPSRR
jgi:hypothetical protein